LILITSIYNIKWLYYDKVNRLNISNQVRDVRSTAVFVHLNADHSFHFVCNFRTLDLWEISWDTPRFWRVL